MATRSVSLVDRLELEFQGTIYKNAIAFGDVDGDGGNELLICNTAGQLYIFKGRKSSKPWKTCPGLGCVTSIVVGDVKNTGSNVILCLNTEGFCFIFEQIEPAGKTESEANLEVSNKTTEKAIPSKLQKSSPAHCHAEVINPLYKLELPANPKMAILADINGDGLNSLGICYTDRYVRVFQWEDIADRVSQKEAHGSFSVKKQEKKMVKQPSKDEDVKPSSSSLIKQSSKDSGASGNPSPKSQKIESVTRNSQSSQGIFDFELLPDGNFKLKDEFSLPGQIGSIAVVKLSENERQLVASQPAGGYAILAVYGQDGKKTQATDHEGNLVNNDQKPASQPCVYHPASCYHLRNFKVDSEVLGNIKREGKLSGLFCVCTVDGSYFIINNTDAGIMILPISTTTEHRWFAMDHLDISMDGNDAIVLCSWEGTTYVIDKDFEIISYSFGDQICGFRAGMFAVDPGMNVPCFGYVTFLNRLFLYCDVKGVSTKSSNLHQTLIEKLKARPEYATLLNSLEDHNGRIDPQRLQALIKSALS
eukprot:gene12074-13318_t